MKYQNKLSTVKIEQADTYFKIIEEVRISFIIEINAIYML